MRRPVLLLAVTLLLNGCGGGHHAAPSTPNSAATADQSTPTADQSSSTPARSTPTPDHAEAKAASQNVLNDAIGAGAPGCSAAVGVKGTVVWTGVRGVADTSTGKAIAPDTVFDIASLSKQFTATALLLLVDAGKLALDDALSRQVPELPAWAGTVTVGQLMHQTSGIPDYVGLLEAQGLQITDRTTEGQALQALGAVPALEFQPGSKFEYSNSNYLLLGEIVHRVSKAPLPQFLTEHIFRPLDLAMAVDPAEAIPGEAVGYDKDGDEYRPTKPGWQQIGDGGIQTTPSQLVRWADNYRTGRVGGPALLQAQLAGAVPTGDGGGDNYGAGIYVAADGTLTHDGFWAGFVAAFRVSKDRATSLAISCNTDSQDPQALAESLAKLWM